MGSVADLDAAVEVLVELDGASGEADAQRGALKLEGGSFELDGVVRCGDPVMLEREAAVEIGSGARDEGGAGLLGLNGPEAVVVRDPDLLQEAVGLFAGTDAAVSEFLREAALPGSEGALAGAGGEEVAAAVGVESAEAALLLDEGLDLGHAGAGVLLRDERGFIDLGGGILQ